MSGNVSLADPIFPRACDEVGVPMLRGCGYVTIRQVVEGGFASRVKRDDRRNWPRASEMSIALMDRLHLMVARFNPDTKPVAQRIILSSRFSLVVDLDLPGPFGNLKGWVCVPQGPADFNSGGRTWRSPAYFSRLRY